MTLDRRTFLYAAAVLPLGTALASNMGDQTSAKVRMPPGSNATPASQSSATEVILDAMAERFTKLSPPISHEAKRSLINWFGCALGAAASDPVLRAGTSATQGLAPVYGSPQRVSAPDAAFLNCLSSAVYAFDDTHVPTIIHPTGPVASTLLALAQSGHKISGQRFLESLVAGIEIQCAMANAFIFYSPNPNYGLYLTGITGPIGAAAAAAMALQADRKTSRWAIGLAATQAAGLRDTHGAMSGMVVPAFAARNGLQAAQLAMAGFSSSDEVISGKRGLLAAYSSETNWQPALSKLGVEFELKRVSYKPYPCGVVIHPLLNTVLAAKRPPLSNQNIKGVEVRVSERTKSLVDNPAPTDIFPAIISAQHWMALALTGQSLGVAGLSQAQIDNPDIKALRHKIRLVSDKSLDVTGTVITVTLMDQTTAVLDGRNASTEDISLTDEALFKKYFEQGRMTLTEDRLQSLLTLILSMEHSQDFGRDLAVIFS